MKPEPISNLNYFVGKACVVHTRQINWRLDQTQVLDYYVGIVELINEYGVCLRNVVNNKKTFIMLQSVVAIAEETLIEGEQEDRESAAKAYDEKKKEMFKHNPNVMTQTNVKVEPTKKPITKINDSPFVDIASMTAHIRAAKDKFQGN